MLVEPRFFLGSFTLVWEQRKLGEVTESYSGGTPTAGKKEYYDGDIPFIRSGEISSDKTELFISEEGLNSSSAKMVTTGDILYALYGATSGEVSISKLKGAINQAILAIQPHQNYDSQFLMQWLRKSKENIIGTYLQGGQGNLSGNIVKELVIDAPTYEEQKEIGAYLKNIDYLITLHQRKYDKLVNVKKSMLEKMFPRDGKNVPEIRFAGFTEAWEQRKLGEFGKATGGTSIESEFDELGKYKVISIGSYSETSKYTDQGIRVNKTNKTESRILKKNNLTMILNDKTASGNIIGRVLLIDADDSYVFNQRTERIDVYENEYLPDFLYQLLNADNIREKIIRASQGNTQIYVNWASISELFYKIPVSKSEQRKIADLFNQLDNLITLHQRELEKLKNIKKSCLEKMFV